MRWIHCERTTMHKTIMSHNIIGRWDITLLPFWSCTRGNNHDCMFDWVTKQRCSQVNTGCRQPQISFPFRLTRCGLEVWGVLLEYMLCPYLASPSSSNLSFGSQQAAAPILPFPQDLCSTEDKTDWILCTSLSLEPLRKWTGFRKWIRNVDTFKVKAVQMVF